MFTRNEEMPHKIKITSIKQCRLQDINDLEWSYLEGDGDFIIIYKN